MADWYVSSAAFGAIAAFVPSAVYAVGNIVKPTAPALKAQWAFRCTTAGTASTEPAWPTNNNSTITTGGATFTNVTGQSAFGWTAAAGDIPTLLGAGAANRFVGGDRIFVSSDHAETQTTNTNYGSAASTPTSLVGQVLSVNRAGSVPPVAADLTAGATITVSGAASVFSIDATFPVYHYGIIYAYTGGSVGAILFNGNGTKAHYFENCQLFINATTANARISATNQANITLYNSTVRFGAASQLFSSPTAIVFEVLWLNTPAAFPGATPPTGVLFNGVSSVIARGVDLSAATGTLVTGSVGTTVGSTKYLFDSCRIAPAVVRFNNTAVVHNRDLVELVNCFDGTNIISESWQLGGAVTTETTITLSGGATDNVGTFSHKMVSTGTTIDKLVQPLTGFWLDVNNTVIGSSKTATVEIISSASLNNDEISLVLEYPGTASSSLATLATSLPATVLTAASAVTTSTATWNASPATPVKQKLQVTFTPRTAGRVRAQVRLGKASSTVYVDPQVTIT